MGILDGPLRDVASQLTSLFTDDLSVVTRIEVVYDDVSDLETEVRREVSVALTPPSNAKVVVGGPIKASDLVVFGAAESFEDQVPPFDPMPGNEATILVRVGGRDHKVVQVLEIWSGDQIAVYEFTLRS